MNKNIGEISIELFQERFELAKNNSHSLLQDIYDEIVALPSIELSNELLQIAHDCMYYSGQGETACTTLLDISAKNPTNPSYKIAAAQRSIDAGDTRRSRDLAMSVLYFDPWALSEWDVRNLCRVMSAVGEHAHALSLFCKLRTQGSTFATPELEERLIEAVRLSFLFANVKIYSIGANCKPWLILNRWGLRHCPWDGSSESELMLSMSSTSSAIKTIANPQDFLTGLHVRSDLAMLGQSVIHNVYGTRFDHYVGRMWEEGDFEKLKRVYYERQLTFDKSFAGGPRIYVHFSEEEDPDISGIEEAIAKRSLNENYVIAFIHQNSDNTLNLSSEKLSYSIVNEPQKYVWFQPYDFESKVGVDYERNIIRSIIDAISLLNERLNTNARIPLI